MPVATVRCAPVTSAEYEQTLVDDLGPAEQEELARLLTVFLRGLHDRAGGPREAEPHGA